MNFLFSITLLLIFNRSPVQPSCAIVDQSPTCFSDLQPDTVNRLYWTKTTLKESEKHGPHPSNPSPDNSCTPVMFYLVSRHSIRYPSKGTIQKMNKLLPQLQDLIKNETGSLCEKDRQAILKWQRRMKPSMDNMVAASGLNETRNLGCQYLNQFSSFLSPNSSDIVVGVTKKVRTSQTAKAFIEGMTKKEFCPKLVSDVHWNPELKTRPFLYFHDLCNDIFKEHGGKKSKPQQVEDFKEGKPIKLLAAYVKKTLGLKSDVNRDLLKVLQAACTYEFAIYKDSPWCAAFGTNNTKVIEYYEDLKSYLEESYGNPLFKSACLLIKDLVEKIQTSSGDQKPGSNPKSYLYFTHSGALSKLWAELGLFEYQDFMETKSPVDGYCSRQDRTWRTSLQIPFGAHLLVTLRKCAHGYMVDTSVNGYPVKVKGCESSTCSSEQFLRTFSDIGINCNLDKICKP